MSAPLLLRADHVGVRHHGHAGFTPSDVSLDLAPGEVVLLLGPSGSGKSTFALTLDGLVPHAVAAEVRGSVTVAGLDAGTTPVARLSEHVALVFQDADASVVTGTVLDEVCFGPENLLVPAPEVLARAEDALRRVGLWERRADDPAVLSGGGRQRLAIACALALGAPVLVLDEPTANLDPAGIEEVYAALRDVVAAGDRSVVLVEHNLDACVDLVDRVLVLDRRGRLVLEGPVRDVLAGRAEELLALGVWLPVATLAALRLRGAGVPFAALPLTGAELRQALDAEETLPALTPAPGAARVAASPVAASPVSVAKGAADGPVVRVRGLSVRRGRRTVLHDVSLDVRRGELCALVGVNGAGKTTLLQAVAGVVAPPRDTVEVAGLDPARADVRKLARHVGFVFQNPEHQFVRHTVAEELAHALEVQRVPRDEIAARVDDVLARFGLSAHREVHPFLLSGGQKRRLSVGTVLVAGATVLALDEPTFGQDRERAAELLDLLDQLVADGTTVLVVTHDLQLVADHASHAAVLADGRLLAHGPAADLLADDVLLRAGLRRPPLAAALSGLERHAAWRSVTRLQDLPGGPPTGSALSAAAPSGSAAVGPAVSATAAAVGAGAGGAARAGGTS
ncbi:ABC transporter ATP-binding protein [Antribacter gilvus]|uniref:ABC transporter ATP-binding protein n=1 Tax=Antribacter gilvus TaxID=2304675 RepID=UPI000F781977|nr:ATP-binding cassette domain-containing protein [Antribacter gilvus]